MQIWGLYAFSPKRGSQVFTTYSKFSITPKILKKNTTLLKDGKGLGRQKPGGGGRRTGLSFQRAKSMIKDTEVRPSKTYTGNNTWLGVAGKQSSKNEVVKMRRERP